MCVCVFFFFLSRKRFFVLQEAFGSFALLLMVFPFNSFLGDTWSSWIQHFFSVMIVRALYTAESSCIRVLRNSLTASPLLLLLSSIIIDVQGRLFGKGGKGGKGVGIMPGTIQTILLIEDHHTRFGIACMHQLTTFARRFPRCLVVSYRGDVMTVARARSQQACTTSCSTADSYYPTTAAGVLFYTPLVGCSAFVFVFGQEEKDMWESNNVSNDEFLLRLNAAPLTATQREAGAECPFPHVGRDQGAMHVCREHRFHFHVEYHSVLCTVEWAVINVF